MAIDWDQAVLGPLESVFGEGKAADKQPVFYPASGGAFPIDGVFDSAYRDIELVDPLVGTNSAQPVLGVRLARFAELAVAPPVQDDQMYIPSVAKRYLVMDVRADSHGWAKLMLSEM